MRFTDVFVRRPVLATVVSLLILLLGTRALLSLEVREYPKTEQALVTVTTAYPGADADLVQSFITEPLQRAASEAEGIDYVTSTSRQGVSIIQAFMELDYDPYDALAEIQGKVASERNTLPREALDPEISLSTSEGWALIYMALTSEDMNTAQMTDYSLRSIVPRLQALPGVSLMFPTQANSVFVELPPSAIEALKAKGWTFYTFIGAGGARFVCAWNTTVELLDELLADIRDVLAR
jgi:multidrug efflux pump